MITRVLFSEIVSCQQSEIEQVLNYMNIRAIKHIENDWP